ncbi:epimerase [Xaviernesmea oryzae]|uniref:Epimerase n=1 Tax=Xaviernesmea oryzae TaxID=464029 RepID=A0A1Q9B3D5_9HYPH|nr:NAD-dependent epimerase/dehydratase family protein [Xaviernesmea oryzae]OLP62552.1 epimerase [Xaviernesmea oryzae]SEM19749.1 Nucleoside-diphosphate-sugar epimerase [Xaviernesmea oryzae]
MNKVTVIFGFGVAGKAVAERLVAAGRRVRIAQRSQPADLAAGMDFVRSDVLDRAQVLAAAADAERIVIAIGFAYDTKTWAESWPRAMGHILAAAEATGAPTLFFDNMYMYGPQDGPIREDSSFAPWGGKPVARRAITEMWQQASAEGRVCMSALRVSDFYGPGVTNSHLGALVFGRLAAGKAAQFAVPIDHPHDVAYLPDVARAVERLLDLPPEDWGKVWLMPCAPTRTLREIAVIAAATMGVEPRIQTCPAPLQALLRLAVPVLREVHDVRFLFDRTYRIDASKFTARFGADVTPIETGVAETARAFLNGGAGRTE